MNIVRQQIIIVIIPLMKFALSMKFDHKRHIIVLFGKKYIVVSENNGTNGSYNPFLFNMSTPNGVEKLKPLRIGKFTKPKYFEL